MCLWDQGVKAGGGEGQEAWGSGTMQVKVVGRTGGEVSSLWSSGPSGTRSTRVQLVFEGALRHFELTQKELPTFMYFMNLRIVNAQFCYQKHKQNNIQCGKTDNILKYDKSIII